MTLAAGFKFESPKADGVSPILLLSESRYSRSGQPYRDDGKKLWALAKNVYAAFAGNVLAAQRALTTIKGQLALSASGSFEDLGKVLKSSFESESVNGDSQAPHCILGATSKTGDSRLLYARPADATYEVLERSQVVIGLQYLEPLLRTKIDELKPKGLWHPKHFMSLPDDIFPRAHDRKQRAIQEARQISFHIISVFLEIVDDPGLHGANPPLQYALLTPSGRETIELFDIDPSDIKSPPISRKTARDGEVYEEPDSGSHAIMELDIWSSN